MKRSTVYLLALAAAWAGVSMLSGCASYHELPGANPTMSANDAAMYCLHESYREVPENSAAGIAGGIVGGVVGGLAIALTDETTARSEVYANCMAQQGWTVD